MLTTLIIILLCTDEDAMRLVYYLYFESEHWIAAVDCKVMECFIFYFCCSASVARSEVSHDMLHGPF